VTREIDLGTETDAYVRIVGPEWIGERLPILAYLDIADRVGKGDWAIVFVRAGCEDCVDALPDLAMRARRQGLKVGILVVPGPKSEGARVFRSLEPDAISELPAGIKWVVKTPHVIVIREGVVIGNSLG
jgi:hypothetical protein